MVRLSASELSLLSDALTELYAATDLPDFPRRVHAVLHKLIPCDLSSYDVIDLKAGTYSVLPDPPDAVPDEVAPRFFPLAHEHPIIRYIQQTGDGSAVKTSDFVSRRQFHRLALYNEFFRRIPVEHQLSICISRPREIVVALPLCRRSTEFSESERFLLNVVRAHWVQAYENAQTFTLLQQGAGMGGREVVLVSRDGQVRWVSDGAWRLLGAYSMLQGPEVVSCRTR